MLHIEGGQGACPLKLRNFDNFKSPVDQFKTFQVQNMDHFIFAWEPGYFSIFWEGGYSVLRFSSYDF